ncbi:MAG: TorF family putative porin [Parashewanella sp.]
MKKTIVALTTLAAITASTSAMANTTLNVTAASNYSYNGVSQTENKPALQSTITHNFGSDWSIGAFASNVDFANGDGADLEFSPSISKTFKLNDMFSLNAGAAYYTYHGDKKAKDLNYGEVFSQLNITSSVGSTEVRAAYAWDYFGEDVSHVVATLAHKVEVTKGHSLRLAFVRSMSANEKKYAWDGKKAYNNYRLSYITSFKNFEIDLSVEDTNMSIESAKSRVLLSVGRTFNF